MKSYQKVIMVLLTLSLVFAGCSSKNTNKDDTDPTKDNNKVVSNESDEKVKITFWHNYGADKETPFFQDTIIPMFNEKYPNIEVEVIAQGNDQYREQIVISAGTKTTPDVARLDITDVAGFAKIGALLSLDDMDGFGQLKDNLFEGPMSTNLYNGKYYGMPLDTNCKAAVYNMEALKALGFDDIPSSMEDFIKASVDKGSYTLNVSSAGEWDFLPYFWTFGGVLTDENFTKATGYLDSQASIDAMNKLKEIHGEGMFTIKEIDGTTDAWDGIKSGEYAMFLEGPWFFAFTGDWEELGLKPALIPTYNGQSSSIVGGESIGIFSTSKHPEEAFLFVQFLLSEDIQVLMGKEMGQMPVLKSAAKHATLTDNQVWSVYLEQLNSANTRIPSPEKATIQEHLKDAFDSIMRGEQTTEEGLKQAASLIDDVLSEK